MNSPIIGQWLTVSDESDRVYMLPFVGKDITVTRIVEMPGEPLMVYGIAENGGQWNGYISRLSPSTKNDLFNQ